MAETNVIRRETIPQLPQDVVANILSRLPAKRLIQLSCVCKLWRSLIFDPYFVKLQFAQSNKLRDRRFLTFTHPLCTVDFENWGDGHDHVVHLEYPFVIQKSLDIGGLIRRCKACNGLILIVFWNGHGFLWNPTIRKAVELTNPGDFVLEEFPVIGFGYDASIDDFKLLRARRHLTGSRILRDFEIFAFKRNTWNKVKEEEGSEIEIEWNRENFLHGALHWVAWRPNIGILAFFMAEERFHQLVELPDSVAENQLWSLGISGDCLFLACGDSYGVVEVWKLKEYGVKSSWTKIFGIEESTILAQPMDSSTIHHRELLLHCTKNDEMVLDHEENALVSYHPKQNTYKTVGVSLYSQHGLLHYTMYEESLFFPDWYRPDVNA